MVCISAFDSGVVLMSLTSSVFRWPLGCKHHGRAEYAHCYGFETRYLYERSASCAYNETPLNTCHGILRPIQLKASVSLEVGGSFWSSRTQRLSDGHEGCHSPVCVYSRFGMIMGPDIDHVFLTGASIGKG